MKSEEIEALELEALYDEKRDKLNARLPIWSLLLTMFTAIGYASVQAGSVAYLAALYPLLAATIARFAGQSERILDRVKQRIYAIETASGYAGYEHDNKAHSTANNKDSGGHIKALRDFILLTDCITVVAVLARLLTMQIAVTVKVLAILVATIGAILVMLVTWRWLKDQPAHASLPIVSRGQEQEEARV